MAKSRRPKAQNSFPFIFWELCCNRSRSHLPVSQVKSPKAEASRKGENSTELSAVPAQGWDTTFLLLNEGIFHSCHFFIYEIWSSTNCVKWTLSLLPCMNFSPTFLILLNLLTLESELLSPGKWLFSQLTAAAHKVSSSLQWLSTLERKIVLEGMFRQATLLLQERKRSNAAFRESGNTKHKD